MTWIIRQYNGEETVCDTKQDVLNAVCMGRECGQCPIGRRTYNCLDLFVEEILDLIGDDWIDRDGGIEVVGADEFL